MGSTSLTYREQLLHPNWQRKRLERLEASGWACANCEDTGSTLHVHHRRYIKGRMVWDYADDDLQVLCEACHKNRHADVELLERALTSAEFGGVYGSGERALQRTPEAVAAALLLGFVSADVRCDLPNEFALNAASERAGSLVLWGKVAGVLDSGLQDKHLPALAALLRAVVVDAGLPGGLAPDAEDLARMLGERP